MPFVLDLLRHGAAEPSNPAGDRARALTPAGERILRLLGARLARAGWRPDRVCASPWRRAVDSARIVTRAAGLAVEPEVLGALAPETAPDDLAVELVDRGLAAGHLLLVGHQPLLGSLAGAWAGRPVAFRPGGMARIEGLEAHRMSGGRIVWEVDPAEFG